MLAGPATPDATAHKGNVNSPSFMLINFALCHSHNACVSIFQINELITYIFPLTMHSINLCTCIL